MKAKGKLVKPENTLKKKVGNGGFNDGDLVRAQKGIENNKIDFRPMGQDLLKELDAAIQDVTKGASAKKDDTEKLNVLMYPLMQLKSQGGLFQYPAISKISHATLDFLENIPNVDDDVIAIVMAYRQAVNASLALEMKDESHPAARAIFKEMSDAFERYRKSRQL